MITYNDLIMGLLAILAPIITFAVSYWYLKREQDADTTAYLQVMYPDLSKSEIFENVLDKKELRISLLYFVVYILLSVLGYYIELVDIVKLLLFLIIFPFYISWILIKDFIKSLSKKIN